MNKYTGEVDVKLGDKKYTLVFDWRAIAEFQSTFGKEADVTKFGLSEIADTLLIGFKKHHPDLTIDDIMDASPAIGYVSDCIVEGFIYAQHGAEEGAKIVESARETMTEIQDSVKKKTKSEKA